MQANPFIDLPILTLQELLVKAVGELLEAMENDDGALRSKKKIVEQLHTALVEGMRKPSKDGVCS